MSQDQNIKHLLERTVSSICQELNISSDSYAAKLMGKKKRFSSMKYGYYVNIQNFVNANHAKKSKSDNNKRYIFRCIMFANRVDPLFEVAVWAPSMGTVDRSTVIYRDDDKRYLTTFDALLREAILFCKSS